MKLKKKQDDSTESPKDWDFDMAIYEEEAKREEEITSIQDHKRPEITNLKSKWSPHQFDLESLSQLRIKISFFAIKVTRFSQELNDLWDFYACLSEYWARIKNIFGAILIGEVATIEQECINKLDSCQTGTTINREVHLTLLKFRNAIYKIAQFHNLSLEVDKRGHSGNRARRGIIE